MGPSALKEGRLLPIIWPLMYHCHVGLSPCFAGYVPPSPPTQHRYHHQQRMASPIIPIRRPRTDPYDGVGVQRRPKKPHQPHKNKTPNHPLGSLRRAAAAAAATAPPPYPSIRDSPTPRRDTARNDVLRKGEPEASSAYRRALEAQLVAERAAANALELEIAGLKQTLSPPPPLAPPELAPPAVDPTLMYPSTPTPTPTLSRLTRSWPTQADKGRARLLAANDASLSAALPTTAPRFAPTADPAIPSALPLPVTDPLPQLRAFSGLTFSTVTTTPVAGPVTAPGTAPAVPMPSQKQTLLTRHEVRGHAGAYGVGVLDFAVDMVVDPFSQRVAELAAVRVSPWARRELAPWLADCTRLRDVQGALYGLDSYHALCVRRAKALARLAGAYPTLVRATGGGRRRRWWSWLGIDRIVFHQQAQGQSQGGAGGQAELVVQWRVGPDDVGEACSRVGAHVRVSGLLAELDGQTGGPEGALARVGALFRDLVEERGGVMAATAVLVELFFGPEAGSSSSVDKAGKGRRKER